MLLNFLNTEICSLYSFVLYWFFPYGSQPSQIISENFILEIPKKMIKPPSLRKGSYKISPVRLPICLSVHPWRIFLRIFSVNFSSLYETILPYTKKWQRRILKNCICCLNNWVNETNLDLKQNIWHFNEGNMVFFCFKWCSIIDHMILWNCIPGKNMVLKL